MSILLLMLLAGALWCGWRLRADRLLAMDDAGPFAMIGIALDIAFIVAAFRCLLLLPS